VRRRTGGNYNHHTSNHGYDGSTATYNWRADNDNNDARWEPRLLIVKADALRSVRRHAVPKGCLRIE